MRFLKARPGAAPSWCACQRLPRKSRNPGHLFPSSLARHRLQSDGNQLGNERCMYSAVLVLDLLGIMGLVKSKIEALPLSEIAYVYINTAHHASAFMRHSRSSSAIKPARPCRCQLSMMKPARQCSCQRSMMKPARQCRCQCNIMKPARQCRCHNSLYSIMKYACIDVLSLYGSRIQYTYVYIYRGA